MVPPSSLRRIQCKTIALTNRQLLRPRLTAGDGVNNGASRDLGGAREADSMDAGISAQRDAAPKVPDSLTGVLVPDARFFRVSRLSIPPP